MNKLYIMRLSLMAQAYRDQGELPGAAGMTFDEGFAMVVDDEWLKMKKRYLKCDLLIDRAVRRHPGRRQDPSGHSAGHRGGEGWRGGAVHGLRAAGRRPQGRPGQGHIEEEAEVLRPLQAAHHRRAGIPGQVVSRMLV